jgi:competence protein ComEA
MSFMREWFENQKVKVLAGAVLILGIFVYFTYQSLEREEYDIEVSTIPVINEEDAAFGQVEEVPEITIMVDLKGAVNLPGVYKGEKGQRVYDIIEKAGGFKEDADTNLVNLSQYIEDEMVIYVPIIGESVGKVPGMDMGNQLLNINKATETELQTLPGIGPSKASAIMEFRETNGGFKNIEDLKKISGIGEKTFEKLAPLISVD